MTTLNDIANLRKMIDPVFGGKLPWDYRIFWPHMDDPAFFTVSIQDKEGGKWRDVNYRIELTEIK